MNPKVYRAETGWEKDAGGGKDAPRVCLGSPLPLLIKDVGPGW